MAWLQPSESSNGLLCARLCLEDSKFPCWALTLEVTRAGHVRVASCLVDLGHGLKFALLSNTVCILIFSCLSGSPLCLRGSEAAQLVELYHLLSPKHQHQILPALKRKPSSTLFQTVHNPGHAPLTRYFCGCSTSPTITEAERVCAGVCTLRGGEWSVLRFASHGLSSCSAAHGLPLCSTGLDFHSPRRKTFGHICGAFLDRVN